MYKLGAIAEKIYKELFTPENIEKIRKNKNIRGGCIDVTEHFDFLPEGSYIQIILNINSKSKDFVTYFDQDILGATIELNVWRSYFLSNTQKENKDYFNMVLVHELCHALDKILTNGKAEPSNSYRIDEVRSKVKNYMLDSMEVNAYVHEIAIYKRAIKKMRNYEDFLNFLINKISTFSTAHESLDEKEFYDVMKVYLRRLARENILPKCFAR
jgi:hypothetical protein